jgi:amino acid adenylation domain-containing protein
MSADKKDMEEEIKPVDFDPFAGREILLIAPTVEPQQEIWLSCIIGGPDANRGYNESVSLLMNGDWNQPAMEKSLDALIQRHEALRAAFSADGSEICIYKEFPLNLTYEDLSGISVGEQKEYIRSFAKTDASIPFDLLNGPLFRFAIFTLDNKTHYLTLTAHHIICDGWSVGIMLQDLGKLYSAYSKGLEPRLPEAIRFTQYAKEEWAFEKTAEYNEIQNYWLEQYKDKPVQLNLPIDFPRPAIRTYKSQRDDFKLNPALIQSLKKLGARTGSSLVSTLLCSFEIFLSRLTGQEDIVLGLPVSGQSATGNHALVGHCVHLLLLRSHPNPSRGFLEFLKERKSKILDDYDHQRFTFGSLLKKLNIARDPSRVPLVPVVFNMDMGLDDGVSFEGLSYEMFYNPREYENFELSVNASGSEQQFVMEWSYNSQLFKPSTIKNMMEEFEALLHALVADPEKKIGEIPALHSQHISSQDHAGDYPKDKTIAALFSEQAALTPNRTALVFGNDQLSYRQLEERSNQLANFLRNKGVSSTSLVPLCIERSLDLLVGILGILKAGAAYVPLDPEYPGDRIQYMLNDISAKILITSRTTRKKLLGTGNLENVLIDEDWNIISRESGNPPKITGNGKSLAYIMYTSGSTGKPKGVMIENSNVISLVRGTKFVNLTGNEVILSTGSTSFDATTFEYWAALLNGGELVLCSEQTLLNGHLLKETIDKRKVNMMWFTSGLLNQWIDLDIKIFADLKTILAGGEKLSEQHIEKLRNTYPSLEIVNGYGPTENTTFSLTYTITENKIGQSIPIGRPLSNRTAYVLNPQQQLCAVGVIGELYVGGDGVARGYLNQPDLTVEKFLPDPFSQEPRSRMYRTGDLARSLPDGNIEYHGRMDDQVKIRGYRIEPAEIEFVLKQNPGIQQAVVIVSEEQELDKRLIAYVVPEGEFNKEKLVGFLQSKLPSYMVPREFVQLSRLPLTANGKVDKKALPAPGTVSTSGIRKIRVPETEQQKLMAEIWINALGIKQLSIDDNFFEMGGHSLIAVKVMRKIEEKTGNRLPITALFEAPTVEKLSLMLEQEGKVFSWKSLVPIKPEGNKPPLYIVHGSGLTVLVFRSLAMGLDPDQPVYGLQARGLNGIDEPFDSMEDIAAFYIQEILEQNPEGPYSLAGYSFGGIVAFEMAKQLKAKGKEVNMLAIFDTNADNSVYLDQRSVKWRKKFFRQFPKFKFFIQSFLKNPVGTIHYQYLFVKHKVMHLLAATGLVKKEVDDDDSLEHADKINEHHSIAFRKYIMGPYNGTIDLFRVKNRLYYLDDPTYLGWKPYALKGLNIHEISGDHKTFLLTPNVQELSRMMREIINERNEESKKQDGYVNPSSVLKAI